MKFAVLFGLVLCLLTVHAQDDQKKSGAQKIIESTLDKIQKLFDAGMTKAQELVGKMFEAIDSASEAVKSAIESGQNAIKDMAAKGQKYLKCAEEKKPALSEIAENSAADVAACKEAANGKTKDVLEGLKNQMVDAQKQVGQVIANCFEKSPFTAMLCATKEAAITYAKASAEIVKSVMQSKALITEASKEAQQCVKEAQAKAQSETENVLKEIQACANAA